MSMTTVQAEASQCLFEFLHMEIVSHIQQETGPEKKVSSSGVETNLLGWYVHTSPPYVG